jgi:hypothetical protein
MEHSQVSRSTARLSKAANTVEANQAETVLVASVGVAGVVAAAVAAWRTPHLAPGPTLINPPMLLQMVQVPVQTTTRRIRPPRHRSLPLTWTPMRAMVRVRAMPPATRPKISKARLRSRMVSPPAAVAAVVVVVVGAVVGAVCPAVEEPRMLAAAKARQCRVNPRVVVVEIAEAVAEVVIVEGGDGVTIDPVSRCRRCRCRRASQRRRRAWAHPRCQSR